MKKLLRLILRPLQFVYSIYAFITFVGIMLLIFPFSIIASFFGRIKGGNMIIGLCRVWADLWFSVILIFQKRIYEAPHDPSRPYIFVCNHVSYIDAAVIPKSIRQPVRPLGKVEMSKVPIFGFIYRNGIVTVDRGSAANRAKSVRILKSIILKGISVFVFPEGTFNMHTKPLKAFYDGAFRIAIETQTPVKPLLFLDTYRRMPFESLFHMSPGINRVLYMDEIPVTGYTLADVAHLKAQVHELMEKKMIEYNGGYKKQ